MIHSGGEIQAVDNDGNSALHAAAAHGKSLSVSALISRGADTQASNHDGQTALFGALQSGSLSTVKNLADNASPEEIFHQERFLFHSTFIRFFINLKSSKRTTLEVLPSILLQKLVMQM